MNTAKTATQIDDRYEQEKPKTLSEGIAYGSTRRPDVKTLINIRIEQLHRSAVQDTELAADLNTVVAMLPSVMTQAQDSAVFRLIERI